MVVALDITISGMSCARCVASIEHALESCDGILSCEVRVGGVRIRIDEAKIPRSQLFARVREAGAFDVTGFSADND